MNDKTFCISYLYVIVTIVKILKLIIVNEVQLKENLDKKNWIALGVQPK